VKRSELRERRTRTERGVGVPASERVGGSAGRSPRKEVSYVAFLRAINVGGHIVKMETLKKSFVRLGFKDVETFIASGNVLFTSPVRNTAKLSKQIEARLRSDLGYDVATFLRTTDEVVAVAKHKPFPAEALDGAMLYVGFLTDPLSSSACAALDKLATEIDSFHVNRREWYWLCNKKMSESKISNATIEKTLKVRSTLRGINTIVRLAGRLDR
jgi:uncharacterized protein (DUF1697 family)